ncbi:MAG: serine/threonine-protein kinase, partial [Vicinamibacterales bacterium]
MSLATGTKLGPYEILAPLGAGGMGEVYRAHDTRLDRDVAIKILPSDVRKDEERLKRFEQEARATAALSHPNILAVYDIGVADDVMYVASELLEGSTLRDAFEQPVTPARACAWAVQIANGLAAAHARHIVHRDVKPENLFLTKDGRVKILDFGLARVAQPVSTDDATVMQSPHATLPGTVMGTVSYMSPEQARGLAVDDRSDIFSLGVVLYEMLSGRCPFAGPSTVETMHATLTADPPEFDSVRLIPQTLERIIRRCLEKRPEDRFHSAHDLALALEAVGGSRSQSVAVAAPVARWRRPMIAAAILVSVAAVSATATLWLSGRGTSALPTLQRITFRRGTIESARFEPGSRNVVYSARWQGEPPATFSVHPESPESTSVGQPGAILFAVSPAREAAMILAPRLNTGMMSGTLALAPVGGGGAREVATRVVAADFGADGQLAAVEYTGQSSRVHLPIGHVILERPDAFFLLRRAPHEDLIALAAGLGGVTLIDSKGVVKATIGAPGVSGIAWSPDGTELWYSQRDGAGSSSILAVRPGGTPREVWRGSGLVLQDIASDGTVLAVAEDLRGGVFVQRAGTTEVLDLGWLDGSIAVDMSPAGDALLINEAGDAGGAFYLRKLDGSPAVRLGAGAALSWSSKGDAV